MKPILICLLLMLAPASFAVLQQNTYTTNATPAVDAHVESLFTNSTVSQFVLQAGIQNPQAQTAIGQIVNDYTAAGYAPFFVDGLLEHPLFNPTNHLSLLSHSYNAVTNETYINEGFVFNGTSILIFPLPVNMTNWTIAIAYNFRPLGFAADTAPATTVPYNYGMQVFSMLATNVSPAASPSEVSVYLSGQSQGLHEANKGTGNTSVFGGVLTNNFQPLLIDGYAGNEGGQYWFSEQFLVVSHTGNGNSTVYQNCTASACSANSSMTNPVYSGGAGLTCTDAITTFSIGYISTNWAIVSGAGQPREVVSSVFLFNTNATPDITNYNNLVATCYRMMIRSTLKSKLTMLSGDSVIWPIKNAASATRCATNNPMNRYIEQNPDRIVENYARPGSIPTSITNGVGNMPNNAIPPMNQFKMLPETVVDKLLITDDGRNAVNTPGQMINWQDMYTLFNAIWGPVRTNYGVTIVDVVTRTFTNFLNSANYSGQTNFVMFNNAQRTNPIISRIVVEGELINTNWLLAAGVSDDGVHLNGVNQEPNMEFAKLMSGNSTKRPVIGTKSLPSIGYTNWTSQTWQVVMTAGVSVAVFDASGNPKLAAFNTGQNFQLSPLEYYTATSSTATAYQIPIDIR